MKWLSYVILNHGGYSKVDRVARRTKRRRIEALWDFDREKGAAQGSEWRMDRDTHTHSTHTHRHGTIDCFFSLWVEKL